MPIYQYRCPKCKRLHMEQRSMSDSDFRPTCHFCETIQMEKLLGSQITYKFGREDFHGPTIRERQELQIQEAREMGIEAEYVGDSHYSGPVR